MKTNILTLFFACFSMLSQGQETTIYVGVQGKDMYYKTDVDVYLAALELTFQNEVYETITNDNVMSWLNIYKDLQLNSGAANWSITRNEDQKKKVLLYTDANGVLKPTNGQFVKFFSLSAENTLLSIDDNTVFTSEDATMEASEIKSATAIVDNTLQVSDLTPSTLSIYPNPIAGNTLQVLGLQENYKATLYDVAGKRVAETTEISPSKNKLEVGHLNQSVYLVSLTNGIKSQVFTFIKK